MLLSEFKNHLSTVDAIDFKLPDGQLVPVHYHVTEVGKNEKHFMDCGGKVRRETVVSLQLWLADDIDHRLEPQKLLKIISMAEKAISLNDDEIVVEYQGDTLGVYHLGFDGSQFLLQAKETACLAGEICGVPALKPMVNLSQLGPSKETACTPGGGCC